MVYTRRSRRQRRRVLWILATLTVIVLLVSFVGNLRSDARQLAGYLDGALRTADAERVVGEQFRDLVQRFHAMERSELMAELDDLSEVSQEAATGLDGAEPPVMAERADARLQLAVSFWGDGIEGFVTGMLALLDDPDDVASREQVAAALADLRAGERAYGRFLEIAGDLQEEADVLTDPFPAVQFILAGNANFDALRLAQRVAFADNLIETPDLEVASVVTSPETVLNADGDPVVPFSEEFAVQVVVANEGNRAEDDVVVQLLLMDAAGAEPPQTAEQTIDHLDPGSKTTLTFAALQPEPGREYTVTVLVQSVEGEEELVDNTVEVSFYFNDPA